MPGAWSIAVGANWVAPTAPVLGSAAAGPGVGQATLQWRPSKKSGGLPVEYAYQVDTGAGWSAPIVIAPAAIGTIGTLPRVRLTAVVDCPVVSGAGNPCSYMLVASNGAGSSPVSKVKSSKLRRPDPATGLSVYTSSVALGTGVATQALSWTLPENLGGLPITRETVWRCSTSTGSACANSSPGWTTVADLLDQPPPTDTTATCPPNGTCAYEVWVRNAAGRSATWARTVPATPILLAATPDPVVPHQVDLQWLNPVEAGTGTGSVVLFECDGTQDCSSGTWTNVPADAAPWNRVDLGVTAASSYTCTPSVTCTFRVGYVDASGNIGGVSNAVTVLVAP
jgi:hypothetical protein